MNDLRLYLILALAMVAGILFGMIDWFFVVWALWYLRVAPTMFR